MQVISHTETAAAVSRETGWNLEDHAADHDWVAVGIGPVGQHRDSEALDRSNFAAVLEDLTERFGASVADVRFGHWGVGWVEEITFDAGNPDVVAAVQEWRDALDDYPVADESALSALEYEEALETLRNCSWGTQPGEMIDDLPEDWAEQTFTWLFDNYSHCRGEDYRDEYVTEALVDLGFYVLEP